MQIKRILRKTGFDIIRYEPNRYPGLRRKMLMDHCGIDLVLDVGANVGQYGTQVRNIGYRGRLISFEPISREFQQLKKRADHNPNWEVMNCALGNENTQSEINISDYSQVSSLLEMLPSAVERRPFWQYSRKEMIEVKKLDTLFNDLRGDCKSPMLKIDTQGYEKSVLDGAADSLKHIALLQLEMSLVPLYDKELLFPDMYRFITEQGFQLASIEPGMHDNETGQLFQVDGIFQRR